MRGPGSRRPAKKRRGIGTKLAAARSKSKLPRKLRDRRWARRTANEISGPAIPLKFFLPRPFREEFPRGNEFPWDSLITGRAFLFSFSPRAIDRRGDASKFPRDILRLKRSYL